MSRCLQEGHEHPEHRERLGVDWQELVEASIERVRGLGMRKTRALETVLEHMARNLRPHTIGDLRHDLGAVCDTATLYRMIERLVEAGVMRRIGLHERALYYELVVPDRHSDYLICTRCGAIGDIRPQCPVHELEESLAAETGYADLHHDLVFYGVCPECHKQKALA